ncbi:hypothetical protein V496_05357 [Pseudogymnoascus sp. VKM F-4515 (FW-2607)]|nr:hypothetical protein V496_05357 [Pseudogymnoascus sp. VKM F-4515 (FW-2607)]
MTSPGQHIFGLGLTLEAIGDAASSHDDGLGLFSDIYDAGVGCGDADSECPGTESVSFNQNIDNNSQIQPLTRNETLSLPFSNSPDIDIRQQPAIRTGLPTPPFNDSLDIQKHTATRKSPDIQHQQVIRRSPDIQQQPFTGTEPTWSLSSNYNSCGTQQQPIIIKETPELRSNNFWDIQQQHSDAVNETDGLQPLLGDLYDDIWDLPSPNDPFWAHFLQGTIQTQTNNGVSNHEQDHSAYTYTELDSGQDPFQNRTVNSINNDDMNPGAYSEHDLGQGPFQTRTINGTSNYETSLGVNNEYNPGFAGPAQIPQAQTSYVNQEVPHTTQPQQGNPRPAGQEISSDTINKLSEFHPLHQYLAQSSQQPHRPLKRAAGEEHIPVPNDAPILQIPAAKRLKTNNGNAAPVPGKVKVKDGKINPRTARRIELDPTQYYQPLERIPQSWGPINPDGRPRFRYNGFGELQPGMTFTGDEMLEYLFGTFPRLDNLESNNPSLFIQCVPSDSNSRYPTTLSNKCRFTDCPVKTRTIPSGHFRVAFDEQNDEKLDPYHCAGYVHLYCLERFCSFTCLAQYCNLVPDTRTLREGRNRMSITRDHSEFARMCMVYMEDSRHRDPHADGWDYKNTLCSALTEEYLRLEARVRRATRERQGGNNIGVHRNDMDLYAWGQEHKMLLRSMAAQNKPRKRKRRSDEEDDDGRDGNVHGR